MARVGWKRHISLRACMHRVCKTYNLVDFARRDAIVASITLASGTTIDTIRGCSSTFGRMASCRGQRRLTWTSTNEGPNQLDPQAVSIGALDRGHSSSRSSSSRSSRSNRNSRRKTKRRGTSGHHCQLKHPMMRIQIQLLHRHMHQNGRSVEMLPRRFSNPTRHQRSSNRPHHVPCPCTTTTTTTI